jgi:hypothetical protein
MSASPRSESVHCQESIFNFRNEVGRTTLREGQVRQPAAPQLLSKTGKDKKETPIRSFLFVFYRATQTA